jgi:hypothetical protein
MGLSPVCHTCENAYSTIYGASQSFTSPANEQPGVL